MTVDVEQLKDEYPIDDVIGQFIALHWEKNELVGLCPFHAERTGSFTVAPDKGFFHCFGCDAHGDVIAFVMQLKNVDFLEACELITGDELRPPERPVRPAAPTGGHDEASRRATALRIWRTAGPIMGTLGERYLRSRGVLMPLLPVSLRFAPRLWNSDAEQAFPAIVAGVQDPAGKVAGIHRTWLRPDGAGKAPINEPRLRLGPVDGGAIRLAPPAPRLVLAEGYETGLSVLDARLPDVTVWAVMSANGLKKLALPDWAERIVIAGENDRTSRREAKIAASCYETAGRPTTIGLSVFGSDFNDWAQRNMRKRRQGAQCEGQHD